MKKILVAFQMLAVLAVTTISSCRKADNISDKTNTPGSANGQLQKPQSWYGILIAAVAVTVAAIKMTEGQAHTTTTTTTNPNGSKTTTTTTICSGLGSCGGSMKHSSSGTSLQNNDPFFENARDYELNVEIVKSNLNKFYLKVSPENNIKTNFDRFFYDEYIKFLNPGDEYTINNSIALEELGISEPIVIKGGTYRVIEQGEDKYIEVGN